MSQIIITIGRQLNNDIPIAHPSVSSHHAELIVTDDWVELVDKQSTNGTILNGLRISRAHLHKTDELVLGDYPVDMAALSAAFTKIYKARKTDYHKEYQQVLALFAQYQKVKNKILNPPQWPLYLRIGLTVLAMMILFFTHIVPPQYTIYVMMSIGLLSAVPSLFAPSQTVKNDRLDHLRLEYEDQLACPKCQYKMIYQNLSYWRGRKRCANERCDAVYQVN